jgi:hypothetical protein
MNLEHLLAYCRENGRVCPLPPLWNELWNLLPDRRRNGGGYIPAAPLILGGWNYSSDDEKRERLATHIAWADEHGSLTAISTFLHNLAESDWHHTK